MWHRNPPQGFYAPTPFIHHISGRVIFRGQKTPSVGRVIFCRTPLITRKNRAGRGTDGQVAPPPLGEKRRGGESFIIST